MNPYLLIGLPMAVFGAPAMTLIFGLPLLMMLSNDAGLTIFRYGKVDITVPDVFLLVVAVKIMIDPRPRTIGVRALIAMSGPILAYLGVMLASTSVAFFVMGQAAFAREIVALMRLASQTLVYFFLVLCIRDAREVRIAERWLFAIGILIASSIYVSIALRPFGISFGEITQQEGLVRYHGPLGDSVKLFLLPFAYWALLKGSGRLTVFYVFALLASGARLALIGLIVGGAMVAWYRDVLGLASRLATRRVVLGATLLVVTILGGLFFDVAGVRSRIVVPELLEAGLGPRLATWLTSLQLLFADPTTLAFGRGFGCYSLLVDPTKRVEVLGHLHPPFAYSPFSQLLESTLSAGLFGLAAFSWMASRMLVTTRIGSQCEDPQLRSVAQAGYVTVITLVILSPFTVWIQPSSRIGHLVWVFLAFATVLRETIPRRSTSPVPVRRFA